MKVRASEALRRAYQRLGAEFLTSAPTLTLTQVAILRPLLQNGPQKQRQIMEASGVDRSTLSESLSRMATAGLVVAVRMPEDSRATMVSLTPAGRQALERADAAVSQAEGSLMKLVPPADRTAFLRCLRAIAEAKA